MCGIIGLISKDQFGLFSQDETILRQALIVNSIRGEDSTGVFGINADNNSSHIVKQAADPFVFTKSTGYKTFVNKISKFNIVIGHGRKATSGAIISANAHPFKEEHIILVHNGNVENHENINKEIEVDSQALAHAIAKDGYKKTLSTIKGAFAVVWYDLKERALFIWRNDDRPIGFVETNQRLYLASEPIMMKLVLARHYTPSTLAEAKIAMLQANVITKIQTYPEWKIESESLEGAKPWGNYKYNPLIQSDDKPTTIVEPKLLTTVVKRVYGPSSSQSLQEVRKTYPLDSSVLFQVAGFELYAGSRFKVSGNAYLPDCKPVLGHIFCNDKVVLDDVLKWRDAPVLIAKVDKIIGPSNADVNLHLKEAHIEQSMLITWNQNFISEMEWKLLSVTRKCTKCGGSLPYNDVKWTSIKPANLGQYKSLVCKACVIDGISRMKQEEKDALLKSRNLSI